MYNEEGQNKEMYFALDNEDLKKLKNNILRAQRKEETIKKQFKISKIPFIDIR